METPRFVTREEHTEYGMSNHQFTGARELLLGLLAFQLGFARRETVVGCFRQWLVGVPQPFGEILRGEAALKDDQIELLQALVREHIVLHDNDVMNSLASLRDTGSLSVELRTLGGAQMEETLTYLGEREETTTEDRKEHKSGHGNYRVVRPHAEGGLGRVSLAFDSGLSREVALKEIKDGLVDDPVSRERFVMEAQITACLEHPGIVPVYSFGTHDGGRPFYVMRFVQGVTLRDEIAKFHMQAKMPVATRQVDFRRLLQRVIDVGNAVAYAHSKGILHRDLKPSNILLGQFGETLVIDWGLAKTRASFAPDTPAGEAHPGLMNELTQAGEVLGTPAYMSPEQALGHQGLLGPATDIYSLGATLYSVLTGVPPFHSLPIRELLVRVKTGRFPPPALINDAVPPQLNAICLRAMALAPAQRYPTVQSLVRDIEAWLADSPVDAYPEHLLQRWARVYRRHPTLSIFLIFLCVADYVIVPTILFGFSTSALAVYLLQSGFWILLVLQCSALGGWLIGAALGVLVKAATGRHELRVRRAGALGSAIVLVPVGMFSGTAFFADVPSPIRLVFIVAMFAMAGGAMGGILGWLRSLRNHAPVFESTTLGLLYGLIGGAAVGLVPVALVIVMVLFLSLWKH